jgi:hypothetical protein
MTQNTLPSFCFHDVFQFMSSLYAEDPHAKHIYSMVNTTLGVMTGASLGVQIIGAALARSPGHGPN